MIASQFDPLKHGLPYQNGKFKSGIMNWSVLCGGIAYAALDYFYTGIKPPESPKIPVDGNPMETYLYQRQMTAHYYTWHRFTTAWGSGIPLFGPWLQTNVQDSIEGLCMYLPSRPVIICLFGGVGKGHHVVAWACDPGMKKIFLYDSNYPGYAPVLTQTDKGWRHSLSNEDWRGWFMDWGHYTDGVKMPPLAFRYCRTCHGLNTVCLGVRGGCVEGGGHDNHPEFEYFLPWQAGEGQPGWKVCGKCQGLFRPASTDAPFCPALGLHLPQNNNANWQDLSVPTNGAGERGWLRCNFCASLFWEGEGNFGKCCSGEAHFPDPNESFVVDNRTL